MIAAGIRLYGNRPFGWRVSAAFIGTLTAVLIAAIALVLWRSALWAFVAGLLGATESLLVVQSRTSLLDIFEAFWVTAGFLFLVLDKRWIERRTPVAPPDPAAVEPPVVAHALPAAPPGSSTAAPPWTRPALQRRPDAAPPGAPQTGSALGLAPVAGDSPLARRPDILEPRAPEPPAVRVPSPLFRPWRIACGAAFGAAIAVKWSAATALAGAMI